MKMAPRKPKEPKNKSPRLIKLEEQETALLKAKEAEIKRLNDEEYRKDTRMKILLGQAFLKQPLKQESFKKLIYNVLDEDLKRQKDRDLFDDVLQEWGLPPLPQLSEKEADKPPLADKDESNTPDKK
jgi:hypothetical protein